MPMAKMKFQISFGVRASPWNHMAFLNKIKPKAINMQQNVFLRLIVVSFSNSNFVLPWIPSPKIITAF